MRCSFSYVLTHLPPHPPPPIGHPTHPCRYLSRDFNYGGACPRSEGSDASREPAAPRPGPGAAAAARGERAQLQEAREQLAEAQENGKVALKEMDEAIQLFLVEQQAKEKAVQQTKKALQWLFLGITLLLCCLLVAIGYMVCGHNSVILFFCCPPLTHPCPLFPCSLFFCLLLASPCPRPD